jgi:hypothetical protein
MKDQPPQHFHKDALPTVIRDPAADETLLAQWLRRGMEKGPGFWVLAVGAVIVLFGVFFVLNSLTSRPSPDATAWLEVMVPSTADAEAEGTISGADSKEVKALLKVASSFPASPAARWARYQAALRLYQEGIVDLPAKKDAARPVLKEALDTFQEVLDTAKADDPIRQFALMGLARCHEARGDLKEAREAYRKVAEEFAGQPVAKEARERAEALDRPEVVAFYDELYKGDFSKAVEPAPPSPFGTGSPSFPSFGSSTLQMPPDFDPLAPAPPTLGAPAPGGATAPPAEGTLPPLPPPSSTDESKPEAGGELPSEPFATNGSDAAAEPQPEPGATPPAEAAPAPTPADEAGAEGALPKDPSAPASGSEPEG